MIEDCEDCRRCGGGCGRSVVSLGARLFCSPKCFEIWSAGRDIESLERIDALEASNDANLAVAKEAKRLLNLREQQLADCTRAMREVSTAMKAIASGIGDHEFLPAQRWLNEYVLWLRESAAKLDDARAGKAGA